MGSCKDYVQQREQGREARDTISADRKDSRGGSRASGQSTFNALVQHYIGCTLDQSTKFSNWETRQLNTTQETYAANEAHCALQLSDRIPTTTRSPSSFILSLVQNQKPKTLKPSQKRAYEAWRSGAPLSQIARDLSRKPTPLKESSVIVYILEALRADSTLETSVSEIRELVKQNSIVQMRYTAWVEAGAPRGEDTGKVKEKAQDERPKISRAYRMWAEQGLSVEDIGDALADKQGPLSKDTVIRYIVETVKADSTLNVDNDALEKLIEDTESADAYKEWMNRI